MTEAAPATFSDAVGATPAREKKPRKPQEPMRWYVIAHTAKTTASLAGSVSGPHDALSKAREAAREWAEKFATETTVISFLQHVGPFALEVEEKRAVKFAAGAADRPASAAASQDGGLLD